jgi:uncharacterized protein YecE (DUF72 family)
VLLIQLPPSLDFERKIAEKFFSKIRQLRQGAVACEPRHPSWTSAKALALFSDHKIGKVLADPERCPSPDPSKSLFYQRLHGSPVIYKSDYEPDALKKFSDELKNSRAKTRWCIFDNTTFGFATENALKLQKLIKVEPDSPY